MAISGLNDHLAVDIVSMVLYLAHSQEVPLQRGTIQRVGQGQFDPHTLGGLSPNFNSANTFCTDGVSSSLNVSFRGLDLNKHVAVIYNVAAGSTVHQPYDFVPLLCGVVS